MPLRPLDELDDLEEIGLSRLLPLRGICSTKACRGTARPSGRHCLACHARAVQRYRDRHAQQLAARRRDADALRDDRTRAADSARAKLAMALRRGTMRRGLCQICGTADVMGVVEEPQRWRDVVWVCRRDRDVARERRRDEEAQLAASRERAAWAEERTRVLAAIELLPPDIWARLHALAAQGPAGWTLSPEAPLYMMNLVRVYKASRDRGVSVPLQLRADGLVICCEGARANPWDGAQGAAAAMEPARCAFVDIPASRQ